MLDIIKTIANELTNKGKIIDFRQNSIFDAVDSYGNNVGDISLVASRLSIGLVNDINRIRNTFIPFKNGYRAAVKELLNKTEAANTISTYNVESITIPEFIREYKTRGKLDGVSNRKALPESILIFDKPDSIKDLIKFDNAVLDKLAIPAINSCNDKCLEDLWNRYFLNVSNKNSNITTLGASPLIKLDEYIILLGIVTTLKSEKQLVNGNVSDSVYFNTIDIFLNNIKHAIITALSVYETNIKANILIYKIEDNTVYVYEDLYDTFLEDNTAEVLLGLAIKTANNGTLPMQLKTIISLIENKSDYLNSWNNFVKVNRIGNSFKEVNRYKLAYETALVEYLSEHVTDDVLPYISLPDVGAIHDRIISFFGNYKDSDILDIEYMCNEIIGSIVLAKTNYHKFITSMVELSKLNPDLTPEEAATMAGMDLIIDYVLLQTVTGAY